MCTDDHNFFSVAVEWQVRMAVILISKPNQLDYILQSAWEERHRRCRAQALGNGEMEHTGSCEEEAFKTFL